MRNGMKRTLSVALTFITVAATAATAYATGYSQPIEVPAAVVESVAAPKADIDEAVKDLEDLAVEAADSEDGEEAPVVQKEVKSTSNLPVSASAIKSLRSLAKSDKDAVLEFVAPKATLSIAASTIKSVKKVDLSSKVYSTDKKAVIDFRSNKTFGCEVKVTFTDCKMSAARLKNAKVYCDGELVDIEIEFDEDGNPVIAITKGGKWEIK